MFRQVEELSYTADVAATLQIFGLHQVDRLGCVFK